MKWGYNLHVLVLGFLWRTFFVNHNLLGTVCTIIWLWNSFPHRTDEETEGQRGLCAFQKSHSQEMSEQASELRSDCKIVVLKCLSDQNQTCHFSTNVFHHLVPSWLLILTLIISTDLLTATFSLLTFPHLQNFFLPQWFYSRLSLLTFIHIHISVSHLSSGSISPHLLLWLRTYLVIYSDYLLS